VVSFFRDPERAPGGDENSILSPADGTVLSITDSPPEAPPGALRRISIFMSVFNCHVNRAAVTGVLADYRYCPGKKLKAFEEKCSTENEQNHITLEADRGRVFFRQERVGRASSRFKIWKFRSMREGAHDEIYGGWPMILSGLKTLLETGEDLTTPGSLLYSGASA